MSVKPPSRIPLLSLLLALGPLSGQAQVMYKCVEGGVTTYAERPCGKSAVAIGKPVDPAAMSDVPVVVIDPMKRIYDKVAIDALDRYLLVGRNGGSAMDLCVQAGLVVAAIVQAKEGKYYRRWRDIERSNCAAAGISR